MARYMKNIKIKTLYGVLLTGVLLGCTHESDDVGDVSEQDSILVNESSYVGVPFTTSDSKQTNVKLKLLNNIPVDAYVLSETVYRSWQDQTQNNIYTGAIIVPEYSLYNVTNQSETGWMNIPAGNYYLMIENTDYGAVSPPDLSPTDTSNIKYSIVFK